MFGSHLSIKIAQFLPDKYKSLVWYRFFFATFKVKLSFLVFLIFKSSIIFCMIVHGEGSHLSMKIARFLSDKCECLVWHHFLFAMFRVQLSFVVFWTLKSSIIFGMAVHEKGLFKSSPNRLEKMKTEKRIRKKKSPAERFGLG